MLIAKGTLTDKAFEKLSNYTNNIDLSSVTIDYKKSIYRGKKICIYQIDNNLFMITDSRNIDNKIIDVRSSKNSALNFISLDN